MDRSVVFKTKGKLDLRSIMTFGLNSKPNTGHPIGFFGTGLKYAIAVLTRHKIPVVIYIDGRKWAITTEDSVFRDKTVTEVFLERHRTLLPPQVRKLPFTTELGKTWELWQAFRELYSNTLDEKGEAYVSDSSTYQDEQMYRGGTCICVRSEAFVQEFFDKDKTFLPDGLSQREGSEAVQIFDRPSRHIYYRGIRVLDLAEEEQSSLTYNILSTIELTEDRTAKSKWDVQYVIQSTVAQLEDRNRIEKVVTSPKRSFEGSMSFYSAPSTTFLDVTNEVIASKASEVTHHAVEVAKHYTPVPKPTFNEANWIGECIDAVRSKNWSVVEMYSTSIISLLREEKERRDACLPVPEVQLLSTRNGEGDAQGLSSESGDQEAHTHAAAGSIKEEDDIPF